MKVAIIPARGSSVRIPRKNIRMFHGEPIIAYSIKTAQASKLFDHVAVATDDDEIAAVAEAYGAEVVRRPYDDGTDGTQEVARSAVLGRYEEADFVCCIYATAPLMRCEDLRWGYIEAMSRDVNFAFAVGTAPLRDAGQFYWSRTGALLAGKHLVWPRSSLIPIPEDRVCDINTEEDWLRAERMYARLRMWTACVAS